MAPGANGAPTRVRESWGISMTETDRRQRLITSTPHLTPDEVATRAFGTGFRGYAEPEVRGFLKRIAEQLTAHRERENELVAAIDALEEQLRQPRPLSERELLDALGEETARLLRSAREAADDIRRKAEERAQQILDDASAAAEQMRAEAHDILAVRTQEAESHVAMIMDGAEDRAKEVCDTAIRESEALIEAARKQGREMLDEAKAARERVLGDLVRRRALLHAQIEALRGGRDNLLDAYRVVKRTFLEATEALTQIESRAAEERTTTAPEPLDIAAEIAKEVEALEDADTDVATPPEVIDLTTSGETPEGGEEDFERSKSSAMSDVESLFARIRAGQHLQEHENAPAAVATVADPAADAVGSETEPEPGREVVEDPKLTPADWRALRARELDPLLAPLLKRAKRAVQDDQNALLDAVRRHKGRPSSAQVLPELDGVLSTWTEVMRDAVDHAYGAGRVAAGDEVRRDANAQLHREAADAVVSPLRVRITVAIDSGETGDTGGLVERIGARYREWKNQSLERSLTEVLAMVWSRGVYDALPEGAVMWWVPFEEGRCSDCDDNGLEATVKGDEFPTGASLPPAHPGCMCLLAPADLVAGPSAHS